MKKQNSMAQQKKMIVIVIALFAIASVFALTQSFKKGVVVSEQENGNMKPIDQSHRSYELVLTRKPQSIQPNQSIKLSYKIQDDKEKTLTDYEIVHEKIMHFIVVRKDLQHFQHLHPEYDQKTGEFTVDVNFPMDGEYRIFPDFTPGKGADNPMLLPVTVFADLQVGDLAKYKPQSVALDSSATKKVDEYDVTKVSPQNIVKSQEEVTYSVVIEKNGEPVTDLQAYLGALGHSVIIKEGSLDFIHAHASEMDSGSEGHEMMGHSMVQMQTTGPQIDFDTRLPEPGKYKAFTQFQHNEKVLTVDYIIEAK